MYQIFVVEDELLIRQSIRNAIEKMQGPYVFCGEASDGEMALSMMQELMPDILLTDIRMPFLDGFELIRHAKAMMPWLKTVIISGYGDFTFAQKAISLGVDQYLLKPLRPGELYKVIEEMAAQIEKEKDRTAHRSSFDPDEVHTALKHHFMQQLLYGETETGALLERARALGLDIVRPRYLTAVCYFDTQNPDQRALRNAVREVLKRMDLPLYDFDGADQVAVVACDQDSQALNERIYRFITALKHEIMDLCPVVTTVIASEVQRLGAICDAYKTAVQLLKKVVSAAPGQVINAGDTAQVTADIVQFSGPFGEAFQQRLQFASPQEAPALLREVLEKDGSPFDSMLMRYSALIDLMKIATRLTAQALGIDEKDAAAQLSAEFDVFSASGTLESFKKTAEDILKKALSVRSENPPAKYSHIISQAEKYVEENYADPNISLISAARHVSMSAAHFSTVFSQSTGRSFISCLTAVRMEKAKVLLASTNMKLADIAMAIGYNEPNYFSHVFRKSEGMTPKEYRMRAAGQ